MSDFKIWQNPEVESCYGNYVHNTAAAGPMRKTYPNCLKHNILLTEYKREAKG